MKHDAKRSGRRLVALGAVAAAVAAVSATTAVAATTLHGTYTVPGRQGTIAYTAVRGFRGGSEGAFHVDGKRYPGSAYAATNGGTGLVWYYGTSGLTAGNALVTLQPDGSYSGPIWFFNRAGATTATGTVTVTFP